MADRKIRVLLMIDDAGLGGGQQHVLWLAQGLDRNAFDVAVACAPTGYLVEELRTSDIPHYPVRMSNRPSPRAFLEARRSILTFGADIVHTHGGTAGVTGRLAARLVRGCTCIHTYHGLHYLHDASVWRRRTFLLADRTLRKITHRTICVAGNDARTGTELGVVDPARNRVILNGINCERFAHPRNYSFGAAPVIGTIGRLHVQKGHRFLLEALRGVIAGKPEVRLVLVGGGDLMEPLVALARQLGVEKSVTFAGELKDSVPALASMDVFVLSSLWEGMPLVLMEAMASGLPIVATAVDGVVEMIQDGREGLLVAPARPDELADAVTRLLGDQQLRRRLGETARKSAKERFGIERMIRETEEVYRGVRA